ncbi:MAG: ComEC/Rec2 family competence protein [Phycisphaerales bacterium]|nr:ComEC/Rec2 family competence protein [Phycisphaerales bacterium]
MSADTSRENEPGWMAKRPLVGAVVFLILGIVAHDHLFIHPAIHLLLAGICATASLMALQHERISAILLAMGLFFAGIVGGQLRHFYFSPHEIGTYARAKPRLARVELRIDDPPQITPNTRQSHYSSDPKQAFSATALWILHQEGWSPCDGTLRVRLNKPHPRLADGQTIQVLGFLSTTHPPSNPGQDDWANHFRLQRTLTNLSVAETDNVQILSESRFSPLGWFRQRIRSALARGFSYEQSLDHSLLRALVLGDGDPQLHDIQDDFLRTGTSHHLSISGMHIAVLGGFVFLLCRLLFLPPRRSAWIGMGFVVLYGLVTIPSPPVVRSVLLCLAFGIGVVAGRRLDSIQLLAASILVMLIWQPLDLYNAGFQLSFGTVLGLMILTPPLSAWMTRKHPLEMAAPLQPPHSTWQQLTQTARHHLRVALSAGLVAWAVSLPLIAWHFRQLNPWAIAAGILLAPPVFAAMVGGLLKIVLTLILPGLAGVWATAAIGPVILMRQMVHLLAQLPGSDVVLPPVPIWLIVVYYILLLLPLLTRNFLPLKRIKAWSPILAVFLILILPLTGLSSTHPPGRQLRMTLLSVGAGQCAVVELPGGKIILIDAGSSSIADLYRNCLDPFLRYRRINRIDQIYISHANADHFSAVEDLCRDRTVGQVFLTPQFRRQSHGNPPAESMLKALWQYHIPVRTAKSGEQIDIEPDINLETLWPPEDPDLDANDSSMVLRLSYAGKSILFTGDIQTIAQRQLLLHPQLLAANLLIAPHHGSSESTTDDFLCAISPQSILSSNDHTLTRKQRRFDQLATPIPLYRTNDHGAITVTITHDGMIKIEPFLKSLSE